ncbi:ADP-heptose synthase [Candidatus Omnitrophus magneticus]|uniref:ADP-heptose synthase n=1 Tax=Candidatus Omnitrophus magneticus TaxID=1609969 RepID=A0A0F0CWA0_9BACT|nr:ADP-heptose synthase [Candidatus Omnitrophus magneticus]
MKTYNFSTFENCIKKFSNKKVLVIGDLLLDQYIWGDVSRISPEAPVPVIWVKRENYMPGGACNVANNLAELGADVFLVGIIGSDERADILKSKLSARNINTSGVFTDNERQTSLKTRVIAHSQQVVRIDREDILDLKPHLSKKIINYVLENIPQIDGIIIEDYGKGLISGDLLEPIISAARKYKKIISVDPKEYHFLFYKRATVITPNHHEAGKAVGFTLRGEDDIERAGRKLLEKLKTDSILITLGEKGMMLFEEDAEPFKIPTVAQEVYDVSGAGDTVIAVYTLALVSGLTPKLAAYISNCAGGIVVGKVGTATVTKNELLARLKILIGGKK